MQYWLMKSEPEECSIDDALAARNATVPWTGVRNYQARNYLRDNRGRHFDPALVDLFLARIEEIEGIRTRWQEPEERDEFERVA